MNMPMLYQLLGPERPCEPLRALERLGRAIFLVAFPVATIIMAASGCCIHPSMVDVGPLDPQPALAQREAAHRGNIARPNIPDNSLGALRASLQGGVEFLEVDVRRAADGTLFLFHDGSLSRANSNAPSNLRGIPVAQLAGATLGAVTLDDAQRESIPTLADALSLIGSSGTRSTLLLDLKGESDALVLSVLELVSSRGLLERVLLQIRAPERIALVLANYPRARILARCRSQTQLTLALKYPIEVVELERWISSKAIRQAHARGVLVAINLASSRLDEAATHDYLRSRGVDMIMTDGAGGQRNNRAR